ncbi:MAG: hypothetical protein ABIO88_10425, partial [Burkholderiaceae bacterium]
MEPGLGRHGQRGRLAVLKDRLYPWKGSFLSLRMVEWSLVAGLILTLTLVFAWQVRVLQGQAE